VADIGKPYLKLSQAEAIPNESVFVALGLAILALVAEPSAQDIAQPFAAKLQTELAAAKYGFQLAKLVTYA
jgi:hypothetical protein